MIRSVYYYAIVVCYDFFSVFFFFFFKQKTAYEISACLVGSEMCIRDSSWGRSACYPQGSFYPLSDGPSTRNHRITKPDFRPCSTCLSRSQAPFCLYTLRAISVRAEGTFGRLRYSLGGDRPSQTAHLTLSGCRFTACR